MLSPLSGKPEFTGSRCHLWISGIGKHNAFGGLACEQTLTINLQGVVMSKCQCCGQQLPPECPHCADAGKRSVGQHIKSIKSPGGHSYRRYGCDLGHSFAVLGDGSVVKKYSFKLERRPGRHLGSVQSTVAIRMESNDPVCSGRFDE